MKELKKERDMLWEFIEFNPYPIIILDAKGHFITWNKAFKAITKDIEPPKGYSFFDDPALKKTGIDKKMKEVLEGKPVKTGDYWYDYSILENAGVDVKEIKKAVGRQKICLKTVLFPVFVGYTDEVEKIVVMHEDITQRKIAEEETKKALEKKELLLKEINHRIKNNLQIINSLLNLQSSKIDNAAVKGMFQEAQNRIKTMALVHENLYEQGDFEKINLGVYLKSLAKNLFQSIKSTSSFIQLKFTADDIYIDIQKAVSLGLITNEVISNAIKYAFKENQKGEVSIQLKHTENNHGLLTIKDNGCGLPGNIQPETTDTLGMQLIYSLSQQIGSNVELFNENGTTYIFKIPLV